MDRRRRERVVRPGDTLLQELVRGAQRERLAGAIEGLMRAEEARSIDRLLADDDGPHPITEGARDSLISLTRNARPFSLPTDNFSNAAPTRSRLTAT